MQVCTKTVNRILKLLFDTRVFRKTNNNNDDCAKVYITNSGRRYVKINELLASERVKKILRETAKIPTHSATPTEDKK